MALTAGNRISEIKGNFENLKLMHIKKKKGKHIRDTSEQCKYIYIVRVTKGRRKG